MSHTSRILRGFLGGPFATFGAPSGRGSRVGWVQPPSGIVSFSACSATETEEASLGVQDADARQEERVESSASGVDGRESENAAVGEWNSLPALVERLRAALEHSLATGSRRDDGPTPAVPEDSGIDSEEDLRGRNSMECSSQADSQLSSAELKDGPELKKDLKFLEDLLLSDIQTALSKLRETLERIDVTALERNGAASDPTSKLHLLRLVSSLLSRLQVPQEPVQKLPVGIPMLPSTSLSRRRRGTRHTIGVSAEELASARRWLEEERNSKPSNELDSRVEVDSTAQVDGRAEVISREPKEQSVNVIERKPEEIRDKCTKDAINQRQLLEDKNKEREIAYRGIQQVEAVDTKQNTESVYQPQFRGSSNYQGNEINEDVEESEERSRVSKLAAALRQRAELATSGTKYGANKFTAKRSKIKRANTIDIPSYLKLQESLGQESTGCVSLRRPINVGDRAFNSANVTVPTFQLRTENDRKFLALINKNNEPPTVAPVAPFRSIGFVKNMDMQSVTDKNWNSRFSNIKTTFDKPSEERKGVSKNDSRNVVSKRFPALQGPAYPQAQGYSQTQGYPQTPPERRNSGAYVMKVEPTGGFRHAPSSPFRKIEKSTPVSPSKVPASYYWPKTAPAPKNAPTPTNTLREKARMMFDRENAQPSKSRADMEAQEKGFPRPPWLDHDRSEKANGSVTENGRLDYRSFCKQFAPFVGKGSSHPSMESKRFEERQRETPQKDRIPGVVDGKISFKMIPDQRIQMQQYPVERQEQREKARNKFVGESRNMFEVIKAGRDRGYGETEMKSTLPDATLRGSSSVAVQTGTSDDHQDEGRSFRVAPRISKGPPLVCSNASVQTSELDRPEMPAMPVSDMDTGKQWKSHYETGSDQVPDIYPPEDSQHFLLDHNQNYHTAPSDSEPNPLLFSRQGPSEQGSREIAPHETVQGGRKGSESYRTEDRESQGYSSALALTSHSQPNSSDLAQSSQLPPAPNQEETPDWPVESSGFLDDQNIQNQDISPDVGVVTRYTCAIATVASVDSPEPRSEEVAVDSRASSTPSPSQFSWSKSRPATSETVTPEDEIRRHNLLQQSLVRRLQNEITSLNDQPSSLDQQSSVNQLNANPSRNLQPSSSTPSQPSNLAPSHQPSYGQPNYTQSYQASKQAPSVSQSVNIAQSHQASSNQSSQPFVQPSISVHQSTFLPANFDLPPTSHVANRYAKFLAPVPQRKPEATRAHSPSPVSANRVGALREAYETPGNQTKPIHKERSPVPNGVAPNDSSDEYLVSCATKPSRSIVLSKSESWHQLAISNSYPRAPRVNVPASTPSTSVPSTSVPSTSMSSTLTPSTSASSSSHPKPPKPKSPSSQKLRSKQYEASSMADSVKKMEDKIRQYFDSPAEAAETREHSRHRRSPRAMAKGMMGLSRSRTMPGISDGKLRLAIPSPQQAPLLNVNTADVDKVFDDLFEEATRTDGRQC